MTDEDIKRMRRDCSEYEVTNSCNLIAALEYVAELKAALAAALEELETNEKSWEAASDESYRQGYVRGAETARTAAIEEAARLCEKGGYVVGFLVLLRALAPLPASLVVLERETLEKVKAALKDAIDDLPRQHTVREHCITALAAIEGRVVTG